MKPNTRLSQYRSKAVELIPIIDEPTDHETFAWVSQNGKVTKINDIDDRHLVNIYRILKKSNDYLANLKWDTNTFDLFHENQHRLNHISYEIGLRGLIIPKFELYTIIKVKTLFQLLEMGCQVQFPNGYILKGDPETRYIDCSYTMGENIIQDDGLRNLTEEGAFEALNDAMTFNPEDR